MDRCDQSRRAEMCSFAPFSFCFGWADVITFRVLATCGCCFLRSTAPKVVSGYAMWDRKACFDAADVQVGLVVSFWEESIVVACCWGVSWRVGFLRKTRPSVRFSLWRHPESGIRKFWLLPASAWGGSLLYSWRVNHDEGPGCSLWALLTPILRLTGCRSGLLTQI